MSPYPGSITKPCGTPLFTSSLFFFVTSELIYRSGMLKFSLQLPQLDSR